MNQDINSIIEQLAEIDSASAKIMQQSQNEKTKYTEFINRQKQHFNEALQKEVDVAVDEFQKKAQQEIDTEIKLCKEKCSDDIRKLDDLFSAKGSDWADNIFHNIIKE